MEDLKLTAEFIAFIYVLIAATVLTFVSENFINAMIRTIIILISIAAATILLLINPIAFWVLLALIGISIVCLANKSQDSLFTLAFILVGLILVKAFFYIEPEIEKHCLDLAKQIPIVEDYLP